MFYLSDGFAYDAQEFLLSIVDLANFTGDVSDLTFGHAIAVIGILFVATVFFSNPKRS